MDRLESTAVGQEIDVKKTLGKRQALEQDIQPPSTKRVKVTEFESKEKTPSVIITLVFNTYPNRVKTELEK